MVGVMVGNGSSEIIVVKSSGIGVEVVVAVGSELSLERLL